MSSVSNVQLSTVIYSLQNNLIILYFSQTQCHSRPVHNLSQYYISPYPKQACAHPIMHHTASELGQPPQQQQLG